MLPYWILLAIPAFALFMPLRLEKRTKSITFVIVALIFTLIIGLRHEVGGDWDLYLQYQHQAEELPLAVVLATFGDPGYYLTGWISGQIGGGIYLTNTVCATLFMAGVIALARRQPQPWVALFVAVPYLIVVVAMGYTRQSAALGLVMLGLAKLDQRRVWPFVGFMVLAVLFHKTAGIMLPLAVLAGTQSRLMTVLGALSVGLIAGALSSGSWVDYYFSLYVDSQMQSDGALIRIGMNAIPALLYFGLRRQMRLRPENDSLWYWIAIFSMGCLLLLPLSSTAADRISIYFMPIQLVVFSRIYLVLRSRELRAGFVLATMLYYFLVQFLWLTKATHASFWLPYQMIPLLQ